MNWDALGAIAELFGSLAVLLTLIYLARQIQQNNRSLDENKKFAAAQAYQARTDTAMRVVEGIDPELMASLGAVTLGDIDVARIRELDLESRIKLHKQAQLLMIATDNVMYQRSLDLVGRVMSERENLIVRMLPVWEELGIPLRPAIQDFLDQQGNGNDVR